LQYNHQSRETAMNQEELTSLKNWFDRYVASFATPVEEDQRALTIKQEHTREVCRNTLRIVQDLRLGEEQAMLAEAVALFHDVGRFEQYQTYKTFDDAVSVNHGALGSKVLLEAKALDFLSEHDREIIIRAVALHNAFTIPANLADETRQCVMLVRDADKLDIWRVLLEFYEQEPGKRAEAVGLGLEDGPGYSPEVLAALRNGRPALKSNLKTQHDFRLLQLSWIYDLNFTVSLRLVLERKYVERIVSGLPEASEIAEAVDVVRTYLYRRLRSG
jgi:hypothetical protein